MNNFSPARFINCYVPTQACNFRCQYCYIGQRKEFDNQKYKALYSEDIIRRATNLERMGGVCIFNLCAGGETLLSLEILSYIRLLLENGHNVSVVTNGTISKAFDELVKLPKELLSFLYIKFSYHHFELKRHKLMEAFFENIHKIQNHGISFSIDITPYDELVPSIAEIIDLFDKEMNGALPHISVARDTTTNELRILSKMDKDEYRKTWGVFNSPKFDYKISEFQKYHPEYCCAGNLSFSLEIATGNCRICDGAPNPKEMDFYNLYEKPEEKIPFRDLGEHCPTAHCYNCHALLTLGTIPELNTPTYTEMLDRVDRDGNHWLTEKVRSFYSQRLGLSTKE